MEKKSARKNEASENESDDTDRSPDPTQEEEATDSQSEEPDSQVGNVQKAGRSGSVQASAIGGTSSGQKGSSHSSGEGYVNYERGSDPGSLSARYGMDVREAEAGKLQRLEREFGRDRVSRWAEEGMTVETMGKPRDMQAFRARQEERSEEVPTDIEQRNEASLQRNAAQNQEGGPAGEAGVPEEVRSVISSPGRSMDETVQREMESKMGGDFSDVQLHTGPKAAAAADSINARAFTVGNHVAFNSGEYQPDSESGTQVLAHELTHVRQQTEGAVSMLPEADLDYRVAERAARSSVHFQPKLEVSSPDDPAEKQAEEVAQKVMEMDEKETTTAETDADASAATESADSADTDRAQAGTDETGAGSSSSDADVDRTETETAAESAAAETSDTETDGAEPDQAQTETTTESADSVQRTPDADTAGQQGVSGADGDSGAATDGRSQGPASTAEGRVAEPVNPDKASMNDSSPAVGGPGDSPNEEEDGTTSVGRRVLRASDDGVENRVDRIETLYNNGPLQPKLEVSSPDDPTEREAREVAEQVMKMDALPDQASEDEEEIQRSSAPAVGVADGVSRVAASQRMFEETEATVGSGVQGSGKPLPTDTRSEFESKIGADFSHVRVHTGPKADEAARSINAKAYTMGSDIAFRDGNYSPGSSSGKKLLAHELTHVVQQGRVTAPVSRTSIVQRQDSESNLSGKNTQKLIKKFKSNVDKAKKTWKVTLGAMHAAQMTMKMGSDGYKKISKMIDKCSAGLEDFKKISNKVDWIDTGAKAVELVTNVAKLGNINIRNKPKKAAKRFEKICGAAGSLMSASKFPGISAFGKFLGKLESEQFFTHFVSLRKLAEDRYGSIGATTSGKKEIAEKLDQWFRHRDMPPKHKELSDATLEKIKDGAKTAAINAAKSGSVKQALLLFRGYASAYAKWMGDLESWYSTLKEKEKKLKSKWEEYRGSRSLGGGNERAARDAWNAFVEYEKQIEDEVLQFDYTDALEKIFRNNYYSATGEYPPFGEKLDW